jgi:hypothetical protein
LNWRKSGAHIVIDRPQYIGGLEQTLMTPFAGRLAAKPRFIPLDLLKADDIDALGPAILRTFRAAGRMFVG